MSFHITWNTEKQDSLLGFARFYCLLEKSFICFTNLYIFFYKKERKQIIYTKFVRGISQ